MFLDPEMLQGIEARDSPPRPLRRGPQKSWGPLYLRKPWLPPPQRDPSEPAFGGCGCEATPYYRTQARSVVVDHRRAARDRLTPRDARVADGAPRVVTGVERVSIHSVAPQEKYSAAPRPPPRPSGAAPRMTHPPSKPSVHSFDHSILMRQYCNVRAVVLPGLAPQRYRRALRLRTASCPAARQGRSVGPIWAPRGPRAPGVVTRCSGSRRSAHSGHKVAALRAPVPAAACFAGGDGTPLDLARARFGTPDADWCRRRPARRASPNRPGFV